MIWVEILSRHRDIAARYRVESPQVRIGRGYDNDVIVDDPYVAALHVRIFRDEAGQLVAEDMGSANGMFVDGANTRLGRVIVDGNHPIRIGQTYLRVRETSHPVERERVARRELRISPIAWAGALGVLVLGIYALEVWLAQTSVPKVSSYLTPLLGITAAVLLWVGFWAVLSRIFSGRSHFLRNLLVALIGVLALLLYSEFAQFSAFAWSWPTAGDYAYVTVWSIVAAVCFFHLREVGTSRLLLKGALVTTLFATIIAFQTLQRSEALSDSGRQNTLRRLMPPALRLAPLRDETAFFDEIAKDKARLDADRARAMAAQEN
jgi:Inner membrane component of T3SS, cytoplasmic domain